MSANDRIGWRHNIYIYQEYDNEICREKFELARPLFILDANLISLSNIFERENI